MFSHASGPYFTIRGLIALVEKVQSDQPFSAQNLPIGIFKAR